MSSYFYLCFNAFLAASLLPLSAEIYLAHLLLQGAHLTWLLWFAASVGNVLGSVFDWWLGKACLHWQDRPWFPVSAQQLARAEQRFDRHGHWVLLLTWMPVIGDPLCVAAGMLRMPVWRFVFWVSVSKGGRYALFIWGGTAWWGNA